MADLYGLEASGLPPELVAQLSSAQGQRRIAEAMLQSGMRPIQVQQGVASPLQAIAQIAQAYMGRKGIEQADMKANEIASQRKRMVGEALADYEKRRMGQEQKTAPFVADTFPGEEMPQGLSTITQQAVPADPRGAARGAIASPFPEVRSAAQTDLRFDDLDEARKFRAEQAKAAQEARIADRNAQTEAQMQRVREEIASRERMGQQTNDLKKYLGELVAASRQQPAPTLATVADPNDPTKGIVVDARTGKKIGDSPRMTDAAKQGAKDAKRAEGFGAAIQMAEDLLSGVKRGPDGEVIKGSMPTQSGVGSFADAAANMVGITLPGATEAKQLEVVAGKLIAAVPRFEGPQSDKDTALYKQMAADAANPGIPAAQRLAAVKTMKSLYDKQPSAFDNISKPSQGGLSAQEQQELEQLRKRFGR